MDDLTPTDQVPVSRARLAELERAEQILDALYTAGVDSWEGYDIAMQELREA